MKYTASVLIIFFSCLHPFAQSFDWAMKLGSTFIDRGNDLVSDSEGNILCTGAFAGTMDFDPSNEVLNFSAVNVDAFIAKYTPEGSLIWAIHAGGGQSGTYGKSIAIDPLGNIVVAGEFSETANFDPGSSDFTLTSEGTGGFIWRITQDAEFINAWQFSGSGNVTVEDVAVNSNGGIVCCGYFIGSVDFDPSDGSFIPQYYFGNYYGFAAVYGNDGSLQWAHGFINDNASYCSTIKTDAQNNLFVLGTYAGPMDFQPGPDEYLADAGLQFGAFVLKISSAGVVTWVKSFTTLDGSEIYCCNLAKDMEFDMDGNIIFVGTFAGGWSDFDPGPGDYPLNSAGSLDAFVTKLNADGDLLWVKSIGSNSNEIATSVEVNADNEIYIAGLFENETDFDPDMGVYELESYGYTDIFVMKLLADGSFGWARPFGSTSYDTSPASMCIDSESNVYTCGDFDEPYEFNPGTGEYILDPGVGAAYFFKLVECNSVATGNIAVAACESYASPSGNFVWTESGIYSDLWVTEFGCDSLVTIDLTIGEITDEVIIIENGLQAVQADAEYQWLDCSGKGGYIPDEINQIFYPSVNGEYAVIITDGACTITSDCLTINGVASSEKTLPILIYPNPGDGHLNINVQNALPLNYKIVDVGGKIVFSGQINVNTTSLDISFLKLGVYYFVSEAGVVKLFL